MERDRRGVDPRLLALSGAVAISFASSLVKLSRADPSTAAFFRCAYALPVLLVLAVREDARRGRRPWRERVPGLLAGVFLTGELILWNTSIEDVGAGLATVLLNIQVILVPLATWAVFTERPRRRVLAGLPVAGVGVILISGVLEGSAYGAAPLRGTLFGLAAGACYSGVLVLLRRGGAGSDRPAGTLADAVLVGAVGSLLVGLVTGTGHVVPRWPNAGWLILLGLGAQGFGWLVITTSLPRLPAALSSLILLVQPVGSLVLALILFGERPSVWQLVGVALVLAGAAYAATTPVDSPASRRGRGRGRGRGGVSGRDPARAPG